MAPNNGTFSKREEILDLHKVIKDIKVLKQQEYRTQGLRLSSSNNTSKTKAKTHSNVPPKLFVSSVPKAPVHMMEQGKEDELVNFYQSLALADSTKRPTIEDGMNLCYGQDQMVEEHLFR